MPQQRMKRPIGEFCGSLGLQITPSIEGCNETCAAYFQRLKKIPSGDQQRSTRSGCIDSHATRKNPRETKIFRFMTSCDSSQFAFGRRVLTRDLPFSFFAVWRLRVRTTESYTRSKGPSHGKNVPAWQPCDTCCFGWRQTQRNLRWTNETPKPSVQS